MTTCTQTDEIGVINGWRRANQVRSKNKIINVHGGYFVPALRRMNTKLHPKHIYMRLGSLCSQHTMSVPTLTRSTAIKTSCTVCVSVFLVSFFFSRPLPLRPTLSSFTILLRDALALSLPPNFVIYFHENRVWHLHSSWLKVESATAVAKWKQQNAENTHTMRVEKKNYFLNLKRVRVSGGWERDGILSTMEFISEKPGQGASSSSSSNNNGSGTTANYHVWGYIY